MPRVAVLFCKFVLKHRGWFLIAAMAVIGAILFSYGKYRLSVIAPGQTDLTGEIFAGLGTLICASGVSSSVMKIIATEGFFMDAVAEVVHGHSGLRRLSDEKIAQTWAAATRMLYLKNMDADKVARENREGIEALRSQVEEGIRTRFPSGAEHFIRKSTRHIQVKWADKDKQIVEYSETTLSKVITFDRAKPLVLPLKIRCWANTTLDEYQMIENTAELKNAGGEILKTISKTNTEKTERTTTYTSQPKDTHEVLRKSRCTVPILKDPNWHSISTFLIQEMEIYIENLEPDLVVVYNSLGNDTLFERVDGGEIVLQGQRTHLRARGTILPGQGYGLTFVKSTGAS